MYSYAAVSTTAIKSENKFHYITDTITLCSHPVFEAMVSLPKSMTSSLIALPRSCHDRGKDSMAMKDRAKVNHDFGKDAKINHVLVFSTTHLN